MKPQITQVLEDKVERMLHSGVSGVQYGKGIVFAGGVFSVNYDTIVLTCAAEKKDGLAVIEKIAMHKDGVELFYFPVKYVLDKENTLTIDCLDGRHFFEVTEGDDNE